MKKHKLNLKTKVWHKYVISLGSLVLATSITLGSMYGYSKCSADRTGRKNETDPYYLKNKFVQTNEAKLYFVSGDKSDKVANIIYDKNFGHDGWKVQIIEKIKNQVANKELDLSEYINNYYNENKHYPILNIKYGSFDFFNEYLEAVSAQDFFDFTRWFMFNVSWGPEIITLKEFSIVKGVEMKGNSITLGSHSDLNKEYMTIKFYPDAFFGTMAVYSELSGRGNASDALVYKINNKLLTSNEIKDLLKNTNAYNAYANMTKKEISAYSFRSIDDIRTLIGSKVYALKKPNWYSNLKNNSILDLEKSRFDLANDYLTLINGSNIEEAKTNLKAKLAESTSLDKYNLLSSVDFNSLEEKVIAEVSIETNLILNNKYKENYLRISFTDGSYYNLFASMTDFKQITGSALKTETNDIKNIFNIDKAIEFAKNTYEKENIRYNQTFPLINDKLKEFESQLKFNEDDYTNGKKELNDLKVVKEKELNDLKLTDPTSAQIPTLEADLAEINKDLTALELTYTKTKTQLIAKKDNFISKNITLKAKLEAISKNYSELISSTTEQNGNTKAKEEYAKKIFELAKSLQITASGILQSLSLPLKIDDNDLLSEETAISIYHVDLAYLPNQLISRDSLRLISETNYLNWRDFFNIKNFTNSATDENEFYIYSPHFKSFVEEWNKKHNDAKVKLDYNELIKDIERIKTEKQVIDNQLSEIDAESKSLEQKSFGYIYLELKEAFLDNETEEKDWNIKNFIMPGTEFANSPLITQKDWGDFCAVNFENLDKYLKIVKTRWDLFYNKYSSFVITHKDLAKEIEDARVEMEKQKALHPNWTTDWDEYAKIKSYIDAYEAKLKQWKDLKATNPNYVDYVDVNKIAEFNEALNNVLAKSLEHKDKKENYFDLKKKSLQKDMELRLIKFKFNYLTNIVNRTDKNIQDLYLEYIKKFEDEKANLQIFIDEYITNLKNNFDLKQKLVLEKVKNEKDIEIITQLLNKSDADVQKSKDILQFVKDKNIFEKKAKDLEKELINLKIAEYTDSILEDINDLFSTTHAELVEDFALADKNNDKLTKYDSENQTLLKTAKDQLLAYAQFADSNIFKIKNANNDIYTKFKNIKKMVESISDDWTMTEGETELNSSNFNYAENLIMFSKKAKAAMEECITDIAPLITQLNKIKADTATKIADATLDPTIKQKYTDFHKIIDDQIKELNKNKGTMNSFIDDYYVQKINDLITKHDIVTAKPEIVSKQNEYNQALNDAKEKQRVIDEYKALGIIEANEDQLALYDSFKQKIANITLSNQKLEEALAKVNGACPEEFSNRTTSTWELLNIIKKINDREYELLNKNNSDFSTLSIIEEKLANAEIQNLVVSITTEKINNDIENLIAEINGYKKVYLENFEELKNTEKSLFEYELKLLELEAIKEKINTNPTLLAELTLIENELNNQKAIYETNFASLLANLQSSYDDLNEKISEYETKTQTLKQLNSQLFEKLNDYYQKSSAITNKYLNNEIKNISEFAKMISDFENNNSEIFNEKFALKALKNKDITLLDATNSFKNSFSNYANVKENLKAKVKSTIEAKLAISKEYTLFEQKINFAQALINDNIALFRKYNSELAELKSLLSSPSLDPAQRQAIQDLINQTEGKISAIRAKVPLIQAQGIDAQNKLKLILDSISEENLFDLRKLNFALDIEKANYYNSFKEFDDYANEIKQTISNKVSLANPYDKLNDKLFNGLTSSLLLNKKLLIAFEINKEYNADSKYNEILTEKDLIVAKTKIELREKLIKLNLIKKDTLENDPILTKFTRKVSLRNINKENANLLLSFAEKSKVEESFASFSGYSDSILKVSFNANNSIATKKANEIFALLGYKKVVLPRLVREEGDIKDSHGNIIKGYSLFSDGYENLLDELLDKVPYAAEWLEGEHIEKSIDNNGVIKYELKNGKYLGFTRDSRVGLWSVLKATNPDFKGISIDFLKFVAAHEYGHHMTLNGAQNLGDKAKGNNPIFVSALTPGATPGITNYYNKEALDLYLKARTNLLLTTRTYLNGKYIIDKNGEYPSFIYPHLDGSGNLVYDPAIGEEKEEDIWGTKISDPDILKALKNQRRRFIQNFEGMKKALEERRKALGFNDPNKKGISLFDIWLSNALDTYSGTLNPTVKGEAKYLVFNKTKGIYEFTKASLKILDGILKDGMGNKIKFEEDGSGKISAKIADIEYVKQDLDKGIEGKFIVKEIYVYDKNGQPVISTLLNSDLYKNKEYGPEAVQYVLNKIEEIQKNIESLVVKEFIINGWDDSSTTLSVEPKMSINFTKMTDLGKKVEEYNPTREFYKNYINERDFASKQMTSKWINDPVYSYEYGKPYGKSLQEALSDFNRDDYFCKIDDTTVGAFTKALAKLIISGGWHYLATPYPTSSGFETYIKSTNKSYIANANLASSFTNNILHEDLGSALEEFGIAKALKPLHMIGYELVGNKINENLWLAYDATNKIVSNYNDPGNAIFNKFININSVKKIKLNTSLLSKNIKDSLFNSIYYNDGTQTLYGEDIEFNDIAKWFEFVSLDLEKAVYDATNHKVNWDLDYVKSKFSLASFKRSLKITFAQYENTLNDEDKTKIRYLIEQASDQEVANEIIDRYSKSKLAAFTSAFNLKDIQTKNLFWLFDQKIGFGAYKTDKFNLKDPDLSKFEFDKAALVKAIKDFATENDVKEENLTSVDYLVLSNRISLQTEQLYACLVNNRFSLIDILMTFVNGVFKKVSPSQDALNYFNSKNERRFNEFFTDYTYNFAEVINRDNLQITYTPPTTEFGNMPSFLSGISESTTGLEYVVDATYTKKWLDAVIKFDNSGRDNNKSLVDAILNYNKAKNKEYENYANAYNLKNNPITLSNKDDFSNGHTFRNSYFGQLQINNNGWFKDRWYREFLDFKLYYDQGKDIQDETIRIKDLEGNRVESRARAYWEYYIQSQGVGKRSMSGIWRDKDKDAIAFYGYIPKHLADEHDIKYLAFKDKKTGKITTVALNTKDSNNMFYYKEQNINNENIALEDKKNNTNNARHYLAQEKYIWEDSKGNKKAGVGFVSYASDYIIASKYKNALLLPGHEYEVYFASDVSGTFACEVFLGNTESISENGKTFSQAPTSIRQEKQADGTYKIILKVQDQFNIF